MEKKTFKNNNNFVSFGFYHKIIFRVPAKQAVRKQAMLPAIHDVITNFAKSFRREGISAPRPDKVIPIVVGLEKPQSA